MRPVGDTDNTLNRPVIASDGTSYAIAYRTGANTEIYLTSFKQDSAVKFPQVYHGPYEYSSPLVEEDWLAQTRFVEGLEAVAAAERAH